MLFHRNEFNNHLINYPKNIIESIEEPSDEYLSLIATNKNNMGFFTLIVTNLFRQQIIFENTEENTIFHSIVSNVVALFC